MPRLTQVVLYDGRKTVVEVVVAAAAAAAAAVLLVFVEVIASQRWDVF